MAVVVEVQSDDIPNMPSLEDVAIIRPTDTGVILTITGGDNGNQEVWLADTNNLATAPNTEQQDIVAEGGTTSITIDVVSDSLPESEETFIFVVTDPGGSPVTSTAFRLTLSTQNVLVVTRVLSAPTSATTVSITGLSFVPKFALCFMSNSAPNAELTDYGQVCFFFLDNSGDTDTKCGASVMAETNTTTFTNRRLHVDDDSTWHMEGDVASRDFIGTATLTSDGIDVVFGTVDTVNAMPMTIVFFGGRTCRAHVGANNQTIASLALTTANFQGNFAVGNYSSSSGTAASSGTGYWSFGMATAATAAGQFCSVVRVSGSGANVKQFTSNMFTARLNTNGTTSVATIFTGFTGTGFTWTQSGSGSMSMNCGVVYLDGLPITQDVVPKSSSSGADTIATVGFDVDLCMLMSGSHTAETSDTTDCAVSFGVCDQGGTNNSAHQLRIQTNGSGHSAQNDARDSGNETLILEGSTAGTGNIGTMTGFIGGALTLTWAGASPADEVGYVAIGTFDVEEEPDLPGVGFWM